MQFLKEIMANAIANEKTEILFPNLSLNLDEVINNVAYQTLENIKSIIENDKYSDEECFLKIEEIMNEFEKIGSPVMNRHDFG